MNVGSKMIPIASSFTSAPLRNRFRVELKVPLSDVWALLGNLTRFPEYSSGLERVDVKTDTGGVCTEYVCHFKPQEEGGEGIVERELIRWYEPNRGYASSGEEGNAFGLTNDLNLITVEPMNEGTVVTWDEYYDAQDLDMMRAHFDQALADTAERLIARFGGRIVERFVDGPMTGTEAEVIKAVEKMTEAFHNADIEGVMAAYEDGAIVAFEPGKPVSGNAALRDGFEMFFGFKPRFTYAGHEVMVSGDTALHIAPWTMTGMRPDGSAMKESGLSVAVLRRGENGNWKIVVDNPYGERLLNQP